MNLPELRLLFHRLNNQLGIILAHAELLEAKAPDETSRARAAQVVASALEAHGDRPGHPPSRPIARHDLSANAESRRLGAHLVISLTIAPVIPSIS